MRDVLVSRCGKVTPEQVGFPAGGGTRRVAGLRRNEVAQLAGVSVEYYTQLERGSLRGASESVLDAIARALLMDEAERAHLFDLAHLDWTILRPGSSPMLRAGTRAMLARVRALEA